MNKHLTLALFASITALGFGADKAPAAAEKNPVTVNYIEPEKFTDFRQDRYGSDAGQAELMQIFTDHLNRIGRRVLEPGQRLEVKFTDIDLAGEFEPWRGAEFDDVRIMKDLYIPRATLEFRLLGADGKVLSEGKRQLRDLSYLLNNVQPASDGLRFDKQMLTDWMHSEFRKK
ncbi:MAG: DUF3016 domain-containing protein [Opitutales bacterium]